MLNRFKEKLAQELSKKNIHLQSGIFEDGLLQMAGITHDELGVEQASEVISFSYEQPTGEAVGFSVNNLSLSALHKFFNLFHLNPSDYIVGDMFSVGNDILNNEIYLKFVQWFQKLSADQLNKYELRSLAPLENSAVHDVERLASDIVGHLNKRRVKRGKLGVKETALFEIVLQLQNMSRNCREYVYFHQHICNELMSRLQQLNLKNPKAHALLKKLEDYKVYNRQESVLANSKMTKELDQFLATYKIDVAQADVFEEILLECANIKTKPSKCRTDKLYNDESRMMITYHDFTLQDAQQLVDFFRQYDRTVMLREGGYGYGASTKGMLLGLGAECSMSVPRPAVPKKKVEVQSVTFDGQAIYDVIYPMFLKQFLQKVKSTPDFLIPYQEKSKELFAEQEKVKPVKVAKRKKQLKVATQSSPVVRAPVEEEPVVLLPSLANSSVTFFQAVKEKEEAADKVQKISPPSLR